MEEIFTFEQLVEIRNTACKMLRIMHAPEFYIKGNYAELTIASFSATADNILCNNFIPYIAHVVERFKLHNIEVDAEFDELLTTLHEKYKQTLITFLTQKEELNEK